jgi:hypothetical protein
MMGEDEKGKEDDVGMKLKVKTVLASFPLVEVSREKGNCRLINKFQTRGVN